MITLAILQMCLSGYIYHINCVHENKESSCFKNISCQEALHETIGHLKHWSPFLYFPIDVTLPIMKICPSFLVYQPKGFYRSTEALR